MARPHLVVLDGIIAMEGDGPSGGKPRSMNMILSGKDAVAIDSCVADIIGLNPVDIPVIREAALLGLGEVDMAKIEILGDDINSFMVKDFLLPQTTPLELIPKGIAKGIASFIKFKLIINPDTCRKCMLCKVSCPAGAILFDGNILKVDHNKCVRCMCCHEVCPYKAIHIKRNFLTKLVWG